LLNFRNFLNSAVNNSHQDKRIWSYSLTGRLHTL
jgi:hypothetical protein